MTRSAHKPIIRSVDEGERRWFFGGGLHTWRVSGDESGGSFLLVEDELDKGKATPLHTHPASEETIYVLEGEILMHMDGHDTHVTAGGLAMAPRGVPHAFLVLSDVARLLFLHTPAACQAFYLEASRPAFTTGDETDSDKREVDFALVHAAARDDDGIEIVGPPPFVG